MAEKVAADIYRIEVPLPKNPLKYINSYVIKGKERNLVIDTGFRLEECRAVLEKGLEELEVDLDRTDFLITHLHADHSGLVAELARKSAKVYCHERDASVISLGQSHPLWEERKAGAIKAGFPPEEVAGAIERNPAFKYAGKGEMNLHYLQDGDCVEIGPYQFACIETPGHTLGHICLYEREHKMLFSGDHILDDITPNITLWVNHYDSLGLYLQSLDKVALLDVQLMLPGHRRFITDCKKRIIQLKEHHEKRLAEAMAILRNGPLTAYQVASRMTWSLSYSHWEQFPVPQKWFATGEANSHLKHLVELKRIRQTIQDGVYYYSAR